MIHAAALAGLVLFKLIVGGVAGGSLSARWFGGPQARPVLHSLTSLVLIAAIDALLLCT